MRTTRRNLLGGTTAVFIAGLRGCLGDGDDLPDPDDTGGNGVGSGTPDTAGSPRVTQVNEPGDFTCHDRPSGEETEGGPPLSPSSLPIPACPVEFHDSRRTGASQDGILSIDTPKFEHVSEASYEDSMKL